MKKKKNTAKKFKVGIQSATLLVPEDLSHVQITCVGGGGGGGSVPGGPTAIGEPNWIVPETPPLKEARVKLEATIKSRTKKPVVRRVQKA